jgi:hypothetical protein
VVCMLCVKGGMKHCDRGWVGLLLWVVVEGWRGGAAAAAAAGWTPR